MDCFNYIAFWMRLILLFSIILNANAKFHWYSSLHKPWCYVKECCNEKWITKDYDKLRGLLNQDLFGQHLVQGSVYGAVKGHATHQPQKPLVFSFHGTTGTGKNHVSRLIAQSWFRKGMESNYVHVLSGTKDFPFKNKLDEYKVQLQRLVKEKTQDCEHSIFIFDEIDSFPPGLLNSIKTYLDYHERINGVDFRKTIFLFLSNTGGNPLKRITEGFYLNGRNREDIRLVETERAMVKEIFSKEETGLSASRLISSHLISHFVPFLPLERSHVRECITRELRRMGVYRTHVTEDVLSELQFQGPQDNFSTKGCKNVAEKVSYVIIGKGMRDEL